MPGKVICINPRCRAELKRPDTPFIRCPVCSTEFLVLCHEFPERVFQHLQCAKCPNDVYFFYCFKCQELMSYCKYRMGSVCTCKKCGFSGCYVVCVHCHKAQCFPPSQRYEATTWRCQYCNKPFNFMTCDKCSRQVYRDKFSAGQPIICENLKCKARLQVKACQGCKFLFMDSIGHEHCDPCHAQYIQKTHHSYLPNFNNPAVNPVRNIQYSDRDRLSSNSSGSLGEIPLVNPFFYRPNAPQQLFNRTSLQNPQLPNYFGLNQTISQHGQPPLARTTSTQYPAHHSHQSLNQTFTSMNSQVQKQRAKLQSKRQQPPSKLKQDTLCKICLDKPAEFLNVTCFHMSACGFCVKSLGIHCPICRAQGDFRKVFI